jgi:hypothetical protein
MSSVLHHSSYREARFSSRLYFYCKVSKNNEGYKPADLNDRPKFFLLSSLSICSVDLTDDGFTSADELEEVDIGPGISHDQHLSAKSYAHVYESR